MKWVAVGTMITLDHLFIINFILVIIGIFFYQSNNKKVRFWIYISLILLSLFIIVYGLMIFISRDDDLGMYFSISIMQWIMMDEISHELLIKFTNKNINRYIYKAITFCIILSLILIIYFISF